LKNNPLQLTNTKDMNTISIQNLKCGGCAATIIKKIKEVEGVTTVEVDVEQSEVKVELASESLLDKVKARLSQIGYPTLEEENTFGKKAKSYVSCAIGRVSK